jgi:SSS family solute:Na+ symporter
MTQDIAQAPAIGGGTATLAAFIAYLAAVIGIGVYASRFSSAGVSEFFVGGRRMHRFVVALSAVVSGRSAWLLLGVTGMAYANGASAVWSVVGYIVAELLLFVFYAGRLRRFSEAHDCVTLPDFFAARFDDRRGTLRALLSVVILIFMVGYVSSQFVGGGKAFAAGFGIPQSAGILITAGIVLVYTVLGGFLAVSLTDMVQGIIMILALVVVPTIAIWSLGGMNVLVEQLTALDPTLVDPFSLSVGAFIGFVGIGLGSPGNPHILVRYMSIADPRQLRYSAVVGTIWNVVMAWGAVFIGLVGRVAFPSEAMLPASDTENLYPLLAQQHLHPLLLGVVLASIFAAIMSTADSQLLVATSAVIRDLYEKLMRRGDTIPQRRLVVLSRGMVVALVAVAWALGIVAEDLVFWLVLFAWAGLGAALGPTSILALAWSRVTRAGVMAGVIGGTTTTVVWYFTPALKSSLYELVPGFFVGLVLTVAVSLVTTPPDQVQQMMRDMREPAE